jgi:FkbM family methyltransferase
VKKLVTFLAYFFEYIKHNDYKSIFYGLIYLMFRKSHPIDRVIHSSIGTFFCRRNTNDFQFANLRYEWGVKKFILSNINKFTVFIDAGACTGDYVVLMANKGLRCIAFEPVKSNYENLMRNISLNGLSDKILTFNYGLGNVEETAKFVFDPVNTGASHLARENEKSGIVVELKKMDSLIKDFRISENDSVLIKFDLEGMETEVICGAEDFIHSCRQLTIILEYKIEGREKIMSYLDRIAAFEYGSVDEYNFYARKTGNLN